MLIQLLEKYFHEVLFLTYEMAPYLLIGFFFAGLLHALIAQETIQRFMGGNRLMSVINAALIGIPLPLCSCGVVPTAVSFHRHGASRASTVSFLISTPQTGIDSILVTYSFFGWLMTLLRPIIALVSGVVGGLLTMLMDHDASSPRDEKAAALPSKEGCASCAPKSKRDLIREVFHFGFVEFLRDLTKWFIIGILAAALIATLIPDDYFATHLRNDFWGMIIAFALSVPTYVCASASVPIAAVLMTKGLSPGAALVFLMAGPATNAATITVLARTLGRKALYSYLAAIILSAMAFGLIIDNFLPRELFTAYLPSGMAMQHADHEMFPLWGKQLAALVMVGLMIHAYVRGKLKQPEASPVVKQADDDHLAKARVTIRGMTCDHCKRTIERTLMDLEGIQTVQIDLSRGEALIAGETIDLEKIREKVDALGYEITGTF